MSFLSALLKGKQIAEVYCDSELTYLMLSNGTLLTVRGLLTVEPDPSRQEASRVVPAAPSTPGLILHRLAEDL